MLECGFGLITVRSYVLSTCRLDLVLVRKASKFIDIFLENLRSTHPVSSPKFVDSYWWLMTLNLKNSFSL